MKANELMIGDLINGFGVARRVTGIHGLERPEDDGLLTTMVPGSEFPESNLSFRPCYAQPIPLTAEILEKNGFVYDDLPMSQYFEQYGLQLYYGGNGFRINCGINVSLIIDSVHELQHALRLCDIEKEIEL
jgi:hypothetical protein